MSRSYRKPWVKDGPNGWAKRYANNVVKHSKNVPDGKAYKKFFSSYDICDYRRYVAVDKELKKVDGVWEWFPRRWNRWRNK